MIYVEYDMAIYKHYLWSGIGLLVAAVLYLVIAIIIIARFKCPIAVLLLSIAIGLFSSAANAVAIFQYCQYSYSEINTFLEVGVMGCNLLLELIIAVFFAALSVYRFKNSPGKLYARSFEERLRALQNDRSGGKLTEEEYAEKRNALLESMNIKVAARDTFKDYGEV